MAKDLPYFKFFCSEWNDGDIALEDYEVQGLFINLCSYYWSNECNLSFKKAEKKFKDAGEDLWQTLLDSNIIKDVDNELVITFLDEQREDRTKTSREKRKAGLASAEARRLKKLEQDTESVSTESEHVLDLCSTESQLLRREEKKEEEKKEEKVNSRENKFDIFWELYPKKVAKGKCKSKFMKLPESDIEKIKKTIKAFIAYKPFKDYTHPNPMTYLNQSRWEDVITPKEIEKTKQEIYEETLRTHLKTLNK